MLLYAIQSQQTPLHRAQDIDVAMLLLQSGTDVNVKDLVNTI